MDCYQERHFIPLKSILKARLCLIFYGSLRPLGNWFMLGARFWQSQWGHGSSSHFRCTSKYHLWTLLRATSSFISYLPLDASKGRVRLKTIEPILNLVGFGFLSVACGNWAITGIIWLAHVTSRSPSPADVTNGTTLSVTLLGSNTPLPRTIIFQSLFLKSHNLQLISITSLWSMRWGW